MKRIRKRIRSILTIGVLCFTISTLIAQNFCLFNLNQKNTEESSIDSVALKKSGYWQNINSIYIYNDNWSSSDVVWIQNRTGTWEDPHIIENVTIDGGGSGSCIIIENSNEFFRIRNCTVFNSGPLENDETFQYDAGIKLIDSSNGLIMNNSCSETIMGIYLQGCTNINISRNKANDNTYGIAVNGANINISENNIHDNVNGIFLSGCNNNTISRNILSDNGIGIQEIVSNNIRITNNTINEDMLGIMINGGYNNTLSGNSMTGCGVILLGSEPEEFFSFDLDDTNFVNGNPIYYYINEIGLGKDDFSNPGQIILVNCSDSLISGVSISHTTGGILSYYCKNNTIRDNNISHCSVGGIVMWDCSNYEVANNSLLHCGFFIWLGYMYGMESLYSHIFTSNLVNEKAFYYYMNQNGLGKDNFTDAGQVYLYNCSNSLISDLNVSFASVGLTIGAGANNTIVNVTSSHNLIGLSIGFCSNTTISKCVLNYNTNWGIYFVMNWNNSIINNTINENGFGIEFVDECHDNIFTENSICDNRQGIVVGMYGSCANSTFSGNSLKNNKKDGMLLQNCNNNTFTSNIIRDNGGRGIVSAQNCDMNHFIGNFFMGNDIHAIQDPSNINYWNGSVVGNFWDNYNGKDADSDGIGDTPHYFAGGNDSLPIWENLGPNISINLPADNATFGNTAPDFEVKIKDETVLLLKDIVHVDTMWYTLDGGNINHTFTINQTIDQAAWDALSEGLIILKFYSNDTLGNIGVAEVLIYKEDTTPPIWNPVPTNQIVELGDSFSYDLDATDPSGIQGWGLNDTTYFSVDSDGLITNTSVLEVGIYWLEVWVNDTHDNQRSASLKITVVDTTPPTDGAIPGYNSFFIIVSLLTFFAVTHKYQIKKKKD